MYQGRLGVSKPEAEALAMWAVQEAICRSLLNQLKQVDHQQMDQAWLTTGLQDLFGWYCDERGQLREEQ